MEQQNAPKHLSPSELADALGMARPTIIRWLKRGWVEHTVLPNGRRLIHPSELDRLMATRGGDQCSHAVRDIFFVGKKAPVTMEGEAGASVQGEEGQPDDTTKVQARD